MNAYAGIGSRRTPEPVCRLMVEVARRLAARAWTLRTGGAEGADSAFLSGCLLWDTCYELYLPWPGFSDQARATFVRPTPEAHRIAARHHPRWERLKSSDRALLARNVHTVLGPDCQSPVRLIVCWTSDGALDGAGADSGGTGMALRVAAGEIAHDRLTVINLARHDDFNRMARWCDPTGNGYPLRERHEQQRLA